MKIFSAAAPLLWAVMVVVLSACGAARDDDFEPPDSEDPDAEPISRVLLADGNSTLLAIDRESKRLEVVTNSDDYFQLLDRYTSAQVEVPNFDNGQVLLYDGGDVADSNCVGKLELSRVSAEEVSDTLARVILEYQEFEPTASGPQCPDDPQLIRPFAFYFIETTAELMVVEQLR